MNANHNQSRDLASRFRRETIQDLKDAIRDGIDPYLEYMRLVERLRQQRPNPPDQRLSA